MPSVYLITPLTPECGGWLKENVSEDAIYLGPSLAVEHRYVENLFLDCRSRVLSADGILKSSIKRRQMDTAAKIELDQWEGKT